MKINSIIEILHNFELQTAVLSNPIIKANNVLYMPQELNIKTGEQIKKIKIRQIVLKNQKTYQFEIYGNKQVFHKNILANNFIDIFMKVVNLFKNIEINSEQNVFFCLQNKKGAFFISSKEKQSFENTNILVHNREKNYILPINPPPEFLKKLNFFTNDGQIIHNKYNKFKQINKYLEFIKNVIPNLEIKKEKQINIIDFGCGKAYLSFALYYYLTEIEKIPVKIIGLDLKSAVIDFCNNLAKECKFDNLEFKIGNIADFNFTENPDMVISLHACDIATDFALAKAINSNVKIIFAVPCCQHEINNQIRKNRNKLKESFFSLFKYGIITEKFASLITDVLRGKLLESRGYKVSIEEFIDTEHTPKNILIKVVKIPEDSDEERQRKLNSKIEFETLKKEFNVEPILEKLLI